MKASWLLLAAGAVCEVAASLCSAAGSWHMVAAGGENEREGAGPSRVVFVHKAQIEEINRNVVSSVSSSLVQRLCKFWVINGDRIVAIVEFHLER